MPNSRSKRVIFQPKTIKVFQKGINQLGDVIRPTLGPLARTVLVAKTADKSSRPEMLDNGGLISRRMIGLKNRDEDMGAMFLRHMLWRQYERAGDGTATATVIFQSIYNQAVKYIVDGGNSMTLSRYLNEGMRLVYYELERQTKPAQDRQTITRFAETVCFNPEMASILGEIFDIIGEYGQVDIRSGRSRSIEREYVEGMTIDRALHSISMAKNPALKRSDLVDASILISDIEFREPDDIVPIIRDAYESGIQSLMIICRSMTDKVISVLTTASRDPGRFHVIGVNAPMEFQGQAVWLQDIGILTGGRPYLQSLSDTPEGITLDGLGKARKAWADMTYFGIIGGKGDPQEIRQHIQRLKKNYEVNDDEEVRKKVLERIGKLQGGSATLMIGGVTELDIEAGKELAERTVQAVRQTIMKGTLPGGGVALLNCRPILMKKLHDAENADERTAYKILIRALEEPTRVIMENAGYHAHDYMPAINQCEPGSSLDVRTGKIANMEAAGIIDSAGVILSAVHESISSAALALSLDVLIHKKKPDTSVNP